MTNEMQAIVDYMANLRWKRDVNYGGEMSFRRLDDEYAVKLYDGWWELCEFTDGDIGDVAVGRFEAFEDGETLMELLAVLRALPRMPAPAPVRKPLSYATIGNGLFVRVGRAS